ncbi:MAG TPA: hypothetical protein DCK95_05650 [Anaerolineaceae bacterium]|nr:hypothetical protein [Anaerolineaceae bacterium]
MIKQKFKSILKILKYRGLCYPFSVFIGYLIPKLSYSSLRMFTTSQLKRLFKVVAGLLIVIFYILLLIILDPIIAIAILFGLGLVSIITWFVVSLIKDQLKRRRARNLFTAVRQQYTTETFTKFDELPISENTRKSIVEARRNLQEGDLIIGSIDHELRLFSPYGEIPILQQVSKQDFIHRPRYQLDIVLRDDLVLVRKDFKGDRKNFLNEWFNTLILFGKANIAEIYDIDEKATIIYKNLVIGQIIRDKLMENGAKIMSIQIKQDPETKHLDKFERLSLIQDRGKSLIKKSVPEDFLLEIEHQINLMHAAGITGVVPTYGNVIDEYLSRSPYFIDFEGTVYNPKRNWMFHYRRNQDRKKYNEQFQRAILTEESAHDILSEKNETAKSWYAPINFGRGLAIKGFWSIDSGTGRWEIIRSIVEPFIKQKRILDLGSNNGILPIMMLRNGAKEVEGVELSSEYFEAALLIKDIFEWMDITTYNFKLHHGNILEILEDDWGHYDVVTAFCSLYYLSEEEMAKVVKQSSELAPIMIMEANISTRPKAADRKSKKSSVEFTEFLLRNNGFPNVQIHRLNGYTRPVLIGSKDSRIGSVSR